MPSTFLLTALRLWYAQYGNFKTIKSSSLGTYIDEIVPQNTSVESFALTTLGLRQDQTLDVDESLKELKRDSKFDKDLLDFQEKARDLIKVFCAGANTLKTTATSDGKILTLPELSVYINPASFRSCKSSLASLLENPGNLFTLKPGEKPIMYDSTLIVPKRIYNKYKPDFICAALIYLYVSGLCTVPIYYKSEFLKIMSRARNFLTLTNSQFLQLCGLANKVDLTIFDLFNQLHIKICPIEEGLEKFQGIIARDLINSKNVISYLPKYCKDENAVPVSLEEESFVNLLNSGNHKKIIYKDSIPYLNSLQLC